MLRSLVLYDFFIVFVEMLLSLENCFFFCMLRGKVIWNVYFMFEVFIYNEKMKILLLILICGLNY